MYKHDPNLLFCLPVTYYPRSKEYKLRVQMSFRSPLSTLLGTPLRNLILCSHALVQVELCLCLRIHICTPIRNQSYVFIGKTRWSTLPYLCYRGVLVLWVDSESVKKKGLWYEVVFLDPEPLYWLRVRSRPLYI